MSWIGRRAWSGFADGLDYRGHQIPATRNEAWGFYGTMGQHAATAWPLAAEAIAKATGCDLDAVVAFLDSRDGRHFADQVLGDLERGWPMGAAIGAVIGCWMGWTVGRLTARRHGMPVGIPYLTGFVTLRGIEAEALAG